MLRGSLDARYLDSKDESIGKSSHSTHGENVPVEEQGRTESSDEDDPREMRMKDLDSGVEYNVGKVRYWNTGQLPAQLTAFASLNFNLCSAMYTCNSLTVSL